MSSTIFGFLIVNGLTTLGFTYMFTYLSKIYNNNTHRDEQIAYLYQKIFQLEKQLLEMEESITNVEKTESNIMQSNTKLYTCLEELINLNYDVIK